MTPAAAASANRAPPAAHSRWFENTSNRVLAAILFVLGGYHVLLTASTVFSYTLRYPFMDQFRGNFRYLTLPFPQSVLELENGHHPIIPGIVRVIDLKWFGGMPTVQTLTGWIAGILTLAIVLREVRRGLRGNGLLQAVAFCSVGTLIGWNANARNFIHPHETVQILLPLLFVVVAVAIFVNQSAPTKSIWITAMALCVAATFTFGVGIASFAALMAVAVLRRQGWQAVILIATAAIGALLVYFWILPGGAGVRANVGASRELLFFVVARLGSIFAELMRLFEPGQSIVALTAWFAGAIAGTSVAASVVGRWLRRDPLSELEIFAFALFVFGFVANALIAASRTAYFFDYPGQLFADRYLIWSCVAWSGLAIYATVRLTDADFAWRYVAAASVIAFSMLASRPAVWANLWSASVYRITEQAALAQQLLIEDDAQLAQISDEGPLSAARSFDEMRKRKLAIFAERSALRLGDKVTMQEPKRSVAVTVARVPMSASSGKAIYLVSGRLSSEMPTQLRSSELWFTGSDGMLIGRAAITFGSEANRFLLGGPHWTGFDGYIPQTDASDLSLVAVREGTVTPIARVELRP